MQFPRWIDEADGDRRLAGGDRQGAHDTGVDHLRCAKQNLAPFLGDGDVQRVAGLEMNRAGQTQQHAASRSVARGADDVAPRARLVDRARASQRNTVLITTVVVDVDLGASLAAVPYGARVLTTTYRSVLTAP